VHKRRSNTRLVNHSHPFFAAMQPQAVRTSSTAIGHNKQTKTPMEPVSFGPQPATSRDGPGLSQVAFAPQHDSEEDILLAVGAWDGSVRFFLCRALDGQLSARAELAGRHELGSAVLSVVWTAPNRCIVGTLEGVVTLLTVQRAQGGETVVVTASEIGRHAAGKAVRCLCRVPRHDSWVASGSWDETVRVWDVDERKEIHCLQQQARVFAMDVSARGHILVGTAGRKVLLWDLEGDLRHPVQRRESSLEHQTRAIACSPDGSYFALSSIAGRVAIEYVDEADQGRQYAFKCHRKAVEGVDTIFPVNALAFHPVLGTFATGGSDGGVCVWDAQNKKRVSAHAGYDAGVAHVAFSDDGALLAITSSYTFEVGDKEAPPDRLFVRVVGDEAKPKPRKR
jgi:cell cycle arrest protein BUB3